MIVKAIIQKDLGLIGMICHALFLIGRYYAPGKIGGHFITIEGEIKWIYLRN